ncbi:bestrophin-2 isoform X2 [Diabrotica virgifera virgifera]|uniref:Bestrophin-2 isoform X2 n=1 Tax=Diabrotica virgifera virgifera TaxID=50390 RepID=A0A6P7FIQ7_DIAVI|nr:bestrophin-2 isoform X2 [Diabrotica virgifera virgifera]
MTVTYVGRMPNGSAFGSFWKILGIWRGSVYKLVWRELLAYLFLYYVINFIYRFALTPPQQRIFEKIRLYFGQQSETIPMSFVLGFYVSLVVGRWWDQYKLLPWPDTLALFLNAGIPGANERQRLMRRTIVRYAVLAYVITLQRISLRVKKRFPTWQHVVDSGLMMESEKKIFELMDGRTPMSKYWMPLVWATNIINRARKESIIGSDHIVQTLLMELSDIRRRLGGLIGYDTVNVPLVYSQVVSLALYVYFLAQLFGRQFVPYADKEDLGKWDNVDMYFPFFTAIQFCFYVGWLKVAEVLINPFGEDDDDIELNWLIDRHIKASYMIVDEMHEEHPELLKDQYWDDIIPKELPYTVASEHYRREEPKGSAENYKIKAQDAVYANVMSPHPKKSLIPEDMYADYESVDTPIVERRKSNWFSRQISRTGMGSIRSASTAYSSGGLFGRHRYSVDVNPENGQLPGMPPPKMSIADRFVGRKSGRTRNLKPIKTTGIPVKNRPRIPTPDVTKEVLERESKLTQSASNIQNQMSGVTLMSQQLPAGYHPSYPTVDVPLVQVVLSPIQELDGTGSVNNTLHPNQPGTAALAQAILSPGLGPVLTTPVSVPMTVSQLTSLQLASHPNSPLLARAFDQQNLRSPAFIQAFEAPIKTPMTPHTPLTLTEVQSEEEIPTINRRNNDSPASDASHASKGSIASNTTASVTSNKSLDLPAAETDTDTVALSNFDGLPNLSTPIAQRKTDTQSSASSKEEHSLSPSASAPNSLASLGASLAADRIRKISSQSAVENASKKREVYV